MKLIKMWLQVKFIFRLINKSIYQMESTSKEPTIVYTFVESPINLVNEQLIKDKIANSLAIHSKEEQIRIKQISQRLESNVRRIEKIQSDYSGRKFTNFKEFKNNILKNNILQPTHQLSSEQKKVSSYLGKSYEVKITPTKSIINYQKADKSLQKHLNFQGLNNFSSNKKEYSNTKGIKLQDFLKEVGQVKHSIKELKESIQSGLIRGSGVKSDYNVAWERQRDKLNNINYSSTKYSYTNYRHNTERKENKSYDRIMMREKNFFWLKNSAKVKQFTIDAETEDNLVHK